MEAALVSDVVDLWEAWIDLSTGETPMLYVVGDVSTGISKAVSLLVKKSVQGAPASHLILEVMPCHSRKQYRQAEVSYAEPVSDIRKYQQISICAGEDIIARIQDIEIVY